jgi:hypothetical protein
MSPRNAPCAASATTIGGAPYALNVRNCSAGIRIGESYIDNIQQIRFVSLTDTVRITEKIKNLGSNNKTKIK